MNRAAGFALVLFALSGCGPKLPEPDSEAARLYIGYCSGSGCHGPIPPQSDGPRYWVTQYDRMIELMRRQGIGLPSDREERLIRDYLQRFAYRD